MNMREVREAVEDAKRTINAADNEIGRIAYVLKGRLRKANVSDWTLCELKKELAKFNMHTSRWRD